MALSPEIPHLYLSSCCLLMPKLKKSPPPHRSLSGTRAHKVTVWQDFKDLSKLFSADLEQCHFHFTLNRSVNGAFGSICCSLSGLWQTLFGCSSSTQKKSMAMCYTNKQMHLKTEWCHICTFLLLRLTTAQSDLHIYFLIRTTAMLAAL